MTPERTRPMTPTQKIRREILLAAIKEEGFAHLGPAGAITAETVDEKYGQFQDLDGHWEYESEFRPGEVETGIPTPYSRHYESKSVARKLSDGSWVGWTYWYGGGKHGEPEAVEWMEDAYALDVTEREQMVTVREFKQG
jgi:hypothetical protein